MSWEQEDRGTKIERLEGIIEDCEETIEKLEDEIDELESDYNDLKNDYIGVSADLIEAEKHIEELEEQNNNLGLDWEWQIDYSMFLNKILRMNDILVTKEMIDKYFLPIRNKENFERNSE